MENMNDFNDMSGMNTAGLDEETFGNKGKTEESTEDHVNVYTTSWPGDGSYTIPGYNGMEVEPIKKEGQALEVAALVFGILGLVVCCCNGFFGLVGLILSIVALAKGKKSGKTFAGLVCSIIALLAALLMSVFAVTDEDFQEAFWEGFEQGYESTSGEDIDIIGGETDDEENVDDETTVESKVGTAVVSDAEAGKIIIDGNEITLPCSLEDILAQYEVSDYSKEVLNGGVDAYGTELIYLATNGVENGVYVAVHNSSEEVIEDIMDAPISSVNAECYGENSVDTISIFNGISTGMNSDEVEKALEGYSYTKSENGEYYFYYITAGEENEYSYSLMLVDDELVSINVNVYSSHY